MKHSATNNETVHERDLQYLNDLQVAMHAQSHKAPVIMLWALVLMVAIFFVWASVSKLEIVTRANGHVVPSRGDQIIQSLDPGVIASIHVREGDVVEQGQLLIRIDPTRSAARYGEALAKLQALKGSASRLRAEALGMKPVFEAGLPARIIQNETAAYQSRKIALDDNIRGLQQSRELLQREILITEPMVEKGVVSQVELLRMQRQSTELATQITEVRNKYRANANSELQRVESELRQAEENALGRKDSLVRTELYSPVRGTIKKIRNTTIGGVISAGQEIMDIVPIDDQLLVEAYVNPKDVAFLRPGQNAMVKFTAYDYGIYGGLEGTIKHISPNTIQDECSRQSSMDFDPNNAKYKITIETRKNHLTDKNNQPLPVIPGMIVTADILTGERTVLQYLFKPVTRMKQALTER